MGVIFQYFFVASQDLCGLRSEGAVSFAASSFTFLSTMYFPGSSANPNKHVSHIS